MKQMTDYINRNRSTIILVPAILFLCLITNYIRTTAKKPIIQLNKEDTAYTLNKDVLNVFSAGNQRLLSSILWVLTLLDADTARHYVHDKNSWLYERFATISKLEPLFYENYKFGGIYLSVIKDDVVGSISILNKGIAFYPDDFWLNYYLGFNYLYEMNDKDRAIYYFEKIGDHPITKKQFKYLPSIIAKLHVHHGNREVAYSILQKAYETMEDPFFKRRFAHTLYTIKAEIDLECLNSKPETNECQKVDFYGNAYPLDGNGVYYSKIKMDKLKLRIKEKPPR